MDLIDVKCSTNMLKEGMKQESKFNAETISKLNDITASIENQFLYNGVTILTRSIDNEETYANWTSENKFYDENYNYDNRTLLENCNAQTLERYADFIMNGHFLEGNLQTETLGTTNKYKECPNFAKMLKPKSLKKHYMLCEKRPDLQCNYCLFKTNNKRCLGEHTKLVHFDIVRSKDNSHFQDLVCSRCQKTFNNKKSLKKHEPYCKDPEYFHCNDCSYKTNDKYKLIMHISLSHSSNWAVVCPKCGKTFKNQNSLYNHVYYCGKEPHIQCSSCSYKTKYRRNLISHSARVHSRDVSFIKTSKGILNV